MTVYESTADAVRDMVSLFVDAWKDEDDAPLPCDYPGSKFDIDAVDGSDTWARLSIVHLSRQQNSLSGGAGARMWVSTGEIRVQVFSPLGKGVIEPYSNAEQIVRAYEGKRTSKGAWFSFVRLTEVEPENNNGNWYQINVVIEFSYTVLH